ncbi:tautomerase family protein [Desulfobulbus sp.]|uniref:tautomerase family protein n=1 Tax=Desulfobulbus sp. TaxID=895 RepID=UPI0027BA2C0D|nr:tautomerase family protein [Desulfobulbus sp.]
MPFVQISLLRGKPSEYVSGIVESVHKALVKEFNVPELDKFQVVYEVEPHQLVFPTSYLGVPHSDDIVYVHITCKEGRTIDMKRRLYQEIAALISSSTGLVEDDVFIVIAENKAENWSFGRGKAQLVE